jgi:hypothetical protein
MDTPDLAVGGVEFLPPFGQFLSGRLPERHDLDAFHADVAEVGT